MIPIYPAKHHITLKGYVRFRVPPGSSSHDAGKLRLGHDWVWEQVNGKIPDGMQVHHKNEKKQDNRIENLELIDSLTHKRIHGGCVLVDEIWWKPCPDCGETKPVNEDNWYGIAKGKWIMSICKPCHIKAAVIAKRARKLVQKAQGIPWQLKK